MDRRGLARALRGTIAGSVTTTLALAFHLAGGGALPSALAVLGSFGGAIWVSILIGRRRRSLPLLIAGIAASQALLHTIFSASTAGAAIDGTGHAGHGAGPLQLVVDHDGSAMWWAHLVAGVLTVAALRRGEHILRRLAELARLVIGAILRIAFVVSVAPSVRRLPRPSRRVAIVRSAHPGAVPALRGPPSAFVT